MTFFLSSCRRYHRLFKRNTVSIADLGDSRPHLRILHRYDEERSLYFHRDSQEVIVSGDFRKKAFTFVPKSTLYKGRNCGLGNHAGDGRFTVVGGARESLSGWILSNRGDGGGFLWGVVNPSHHV